MPSPSAYQTLAKNIEIWAQELGFQQVGVCKADVSQQAEHLQKWLDNNFHGTMSWMAENQDLRQQPDKLVPETTHVISLRMNYLPEQTQAIRILKSPEKAYVARYALGRDYHKLMRKRLAKLADRIRAFCEQHELLTHLRQRPFVDSAPVLERPLAEKAGLGWVGKHTLLINRDAGSWFFLGEIYTNLPLENLATPVKNECGDCDACLKVCPTDAFPSPYVLDARRCIAYLTIENKGPIPEEFREPIGNRVFGCDDCQTICPWNKQAQTTAEDDFSPRHNMDSNDLLQLFLWSEQEFLDRTAGSAIRRVGYQNWLRNLAVGLGNAPSSTDIITALQEKKQNVNTLVSEHIDWALTQQMKLKRRRKRKIKNLPTTPN